MDRLEGTAMNLHALAAAVRKYHREHPGHTRVENGVSREGLALLEAVEALPADGVVVPRATLQAAHDALEDALDPFNIKGDAYMARDTRTVGYAMLGVLEALLSAP